MKISSTISRRARLTAAIMIMVLPLTLSGCSGKEAAESGKYTLHLTYDGKLTNFSPTDYVYSFAGTVLSYTTSPFYDTFINEDKTSFDFHPVMAASYPVDVTASYSGNSDYGIDAETDSNRAWQITLRDDMVWESGDPITADDYVYSLKQYIDPELKSYRASSFTFGSMAIAGAKDFYTGELTDFSKVGIVKDDDYTLTFIFASDVSYNAFMYNFNIYLVNEDMYESLKTDTNGVIKSSYGTEVSKYLSYGPYRIENYEEGKVFNLTRNESWSCYNDDFFRDKYQTTGIEFDAVSDYSTMKSLFLQGKLDELGLSSESAKEFGTSDYSMYNVDSATTYLSLNADFDALKARETAGINKTILSYVDFRKAFSLALNRRDYVAKFTAVCEPAYGILSDMYICDLDTMETYRSLPEAKQALCDVYESDNYDELSGYDIDLAREYLVSAYEQCLADGNISSTDKISLEFGVSSAGTDAQKQLDFLSDSFNEIATGTPLEDRIEFSLKTFQNKYESLKSGKIDFTTAAWTGGVTDAYSVMQCYTKEGTMVEYGYSPDTPATITIDGESITMGMYDWYLALCVGEYSAADASTRNTILAGMEKALLTNYQVIPLYSSRSLTLRSQRLIYYTEDIVNPLIARGGIAQMTYSMDDAQWDEYCKSKNYHLVY